MKLSLSDSFQPERVISSAWNPSASATKRPASRRNHFSFTDVIIECIKIWGHARFLAQRKQAVNLLPFASWMIDSDESVGEKSA